MGETVKTPEPKFNKADAARVFVHVKRMRGLYAVSFALLTLLTGITALKAYLIKPILDSVTAGDVRRDELLILAALLAGVFLIGPGINFLYGLVNKVIAGRIIINIRRQIFDHVLSQPLSFFNEHHSTDLASRVVNDISEFEFSTITNLQMFIKDVMTAVVLTGLMFYLSWSVALICVLLGGLIAAVLTYHNRRILPLSHTSQKRLGSVASHVTELINGMELVVSFGMNNAWVERFRSVNQDHFQAAYDLEKTRGKAIWVSQAIAGMGIVSIVLIAGLQVVNGTTESSSAMAVIAVMTLLQQPLASFPNEISMMVRGLGAARRAFEILDEVPAVEDPKNPVPFPERLDIEFRNVGFSYAKKESVLKGISFKVEEGESIAVVGGSGAGKSTVAKLILRFYDPTSGDVLLGGQHVNQLERRRLYEEISYVPQESFLFDISLRDNLTIGRPGATDEEIQDVVRRACLTDYIDALPQGLDSKVGERGVTLSGGERQRIAIARALLRHPRVMVLDEATSAMDSDLEEEILQELVGVSGLTLVAITHRPRMAHLADRVLRLKRGVVQAEEGPLTVEG